MHDASASKLEKQSFVPGIRPSRVRVGVLAFLCALIFIFYLDRVCISQAVVSIQEELHLSNSQMGIILMAFTLGYGLFEIPTGYWDDRFGSRAVLTRIAVWWSSVSELSGRHLGVLFGLMNSLEIPGAMASQYYFGASADWREAAGFTGRAQWDPAFIVYICLLWIAAACWLFVDSTSPITTDAVATEDTSSPLDAGEKCQLCST